MWRRTGRDGSTRMRWIGLLRSGNSGAIGCPRHGSHPHCRSFHRTLRRVGPRTRAAPPIRRDRTWQTTIGQERTGSAMTGKRRGGSRSICASRRASTRLQSSSRPTSGTMGRKAALLRIAWKRGAGGSGTRRLLASHPAMMVYRVNQTSAERVRLSVRGRGKPPGIAEFGLYAEPERRVSRS